MGVEDMKEVDPKSACFGAVAEIERTCYCNSFEGREVRVEDAVASIDRARRNLSSCYVNSGNATQT